VSPGAGGGRRRPGGDRIRLGSNDSENTSDDAEASTSGAESCGRSRDQRCWHDVPDDGRDEVRVVSGLDEVPRTTAAPHDEPPGRDGPGQGGGGSEEGELHGGDRRAGRQAPLPCGVSHPEGSGPFGTTRDGLIASCVA
jgi:hypothetical protein